MQYICCKIKICNVIYIYIHTHKLKHFLYLIESIRRFMRFSLGLLSSTQGIEILREDEVTVATYIKSKLSPRDAVQFDKLHNDLKDGVQNNFISF